MDFRFTKLKIIISILIGIIGGILIALWQGMEDFIFAFAIITIFVYIIWSLIQKKDNNDVIDFKKVKITLSILIGGVLSFLWMSLFYHSEAILLDVLAPILFVIITIISSVVIYFIWSLIQKKK